jgi:hypothetical protein
MSLVTLVDTEPKAFAPEPISDAEAAAMFRAAVNLLKLWGVTDEEAATLLDQPVRSYRRWKAGEIGRINRDGKARLSNLDVMLGGELTDLMRVRRYLDAERGAW